MSFVTTAEIINDAAVELGLLSADIADPFASTNPNIVLLCRLMKSSGQEIRDSRMWSWLVQTASITTAIGQAAYTLPDDFDEMIDQTGWNRSTRFPLGGPLSPQEWQYLQANPTGPVYSSFRFLNGALFISPTPTAVETITFEYKGLWWVGTESETPANSVQTVLLPHLLMVRKLKLDYLANKGFDTTNAQRQFDDTYAKEAAKDSPGRVLSLNGRSGVGFRLIDASNLPDTGYGS